MDVERLERVCLAVRDLDDTVRLFSNLFNLKFETCPTDTLVSKLTEHADRSFEEVGIVKLAMSPIGLELMEMDPPVEKEGVRSFHFKVSDLEKAKAEMQAKGIHLLREITYGDLKEAIYSPDDLHGARLVLTQFDTPSAVDAVMRR